MKHAIELREDLVTIRDSSTEEDVVVALDQILYEMEMEEINDLEDFLMEKEFNATFGNGTNPYKEIDFKEIPF